LAFTILASGCSRVGGDENDDDDHDDDHNNDDGGRDVMMIMEIMIWHGLGVQGKHLYKAAKDEWEMFTMSEMAVGCVYLCFSTPREDCLRQWKNGWDLFTSMDEWVDWRASVGGGVEEGWRRGGVRLVEG